jgi:predicted enzyme related to lactoylglutathione lyase
MAKITGIGGVFFKAKTDDHALREWYRKHLGLKLEDWGGAALKWPDDTAEDKGATAWHIAEPATKWFKPSEADFMINYRIDNMAEMIEQLKAGGVAIHQGPEYHENGAILWLIDPDGNKVELWEPKIWNARNKK